VLNQINDLRVYGKLRNLQHDRKFVETNQNKME